MLVSLDPAAEGEVVGDADAMTRQEQRLRVITQAGSRLTSCSDVVGELLHSCAQDAGGEVEGLADDLLASKRIAEDDGRVACSARDRKVVEIKRTRRELLST